MTDKIDTLFRELVAENNVPAIGGIVLDKSGNKIYDNFFGRTISNDDNSKPFTKTTQTLYWSLTKQLVNISMLQLMERGMVNLDDPVSKYLPNQTNLVITGFDENMKPITRPAKTELKVINLSTHTSGYTYDLWDEYRESKGYTIGRFLESAAEDEYEDNYLEFDPGSRYCYSMSFERLGMVVEAASGQVLPEYIRQHIFEPLGMKNSGAHYASRDFLRMHVKAGPGKLIPTPLEPYSNPIKYAGGCCMLGTIEDYCTLIFTLLHNGTHPQTGVSILKPSTVEKYIYTDQLARLGISPLGPTPVGNVRESIHGVGLSNAGELLPPSVPKGWSCGMMLNLADVPGRRKAGSIAWAALGNIYYWIDRKTGLCGIMGTNQLPFMDRDVLDAFEKFERWAYEQVDLGPTTKQVG